MHRVSSSTLSIAASIVAGLTYAGCGGGSSGGSFVAPAPVIDNVNGSTDPASPVGLAIEVNGSGFQGSPGRITFTQGTNVAEVTPDASGWSDTGIIVVVPSSGAGGAFTVPGVVTVNVVTSGGVSNGVELDVVELVTFDVNNLRWINSTQTGGPAALPAALRGLGAEVVARSDTEATLVVTGGNSGAQNEATVYVATVGQTGSIASWQTGPALPAPRAHHRTAVAHAGNSLVGAGSAFVYVIGGQAAAADAPGGTTTVYVAPVSNGSVGSWSSTSALPEALIAPATAIYNGFLYVVGGLQPDGAASREVYSARINADGSLGVWAVQSDLYPTPIAFARAFGFGGNLYVVGGDPGTSTDPNAAGGQGTNAVHLARARAGAVAAWSSTSNTIKQRKKHDLWVAFGQVIGAEGIYEGAGLELERSAVQSNGQLASWNGITAANTQPAANVFNAAAVVSPIRPTSAGPRFLLLGGQPTGGTAPQSTVYVNTAP